MTLLVSLASVSAILKTSLVVFPSNFQVHQLITKAPAVTSAYPTRTTSPSWLTLLQVSFTPVRIGVLSPQSLADAPFSAFQSNHLSYFIFRSLSPRVQSKLT